ncbi:MAG: DUF4352 domain-containing protein [Clostridia bacterium]|nr:DUF4352 domain-containing protein [Clostridia bacterium]
MDEKRKSGFGTASLVLGIIGIVFSFIPIVNFLSYILATLGFIFAVICLFKKASKGIAIAGLILAILSFIIANNINTKTSEVLKDTFENGSIVELNIGENTTVDDLKITYVSLDDNYTDYSKYIHPTAGNKVIRIEMKFENNSSKDIILNSVSCYADNQKCETTYFVNDFNLPTLEKISSGNSFTGIIYYEVPENSEKIKVEYDTDTLNDSKVIFNVK